MLFCDHVVSLKDFKIMASINSEFHLKIKEILLITCDKPELNSNEKSLPLYLMYSLMINVFLFEYFICARS